MEMEVPEEEGRGPGWERDGEGAVGVVGGAAAAGGVAVTGRVARSSQ